MYDVIVSKKNGKDKIFSVNGLNQLTVTVSGAKEEVICKNSSTDFDVLAEEGDILSVLTVDLNGSLIYLRCVLDQWKKYILLDTRSGGKRINSIRLLKLNGRIHAFYCIEYEGRMMLVHHISEDDIFSREPIVIDYIGMKCSYDVCVDDSMNIHILYADEDLRLKHTVFINSQKNYAKADLDISVEIRSVNAVLFCGKIYAVYLTRERDYNVINCIKTDTGEKHTVGFGVDALSEPCIFSSGDEMFIQWREKGYAFQCSSDDGFKFSKPLSLGRSDKILKLRCHENETVNSLNKCVGNMYSRPFESAKNVLQKFIDKDKPTFKIKGNDAQEYVYNHFITENKNSMLEIKMNSFEEQLSNIIGAIEIISGKLEKITNKAEKNESFKELDVAQNNETEYIEKGEE